MKRDRRQAGRPAFPFRAARASVLALLVGTNCLAPASAEDKARPGETGLSMLEVWKGQAFGTGRADFGAGRRQGP